MMFLDSSILLCALGVHAFFSTECILLHEIYLFILLLMDNCLFLVGAVMNKAVDTDVQVLV